MDTSMNRENIPEQYKIKIDKAGPNEWENLKRIRLEALREFPDAFGGKYEDEEKLSDEKWQEDVLSKEKEIFLAKEGKNTIGLIQVRPRPKEEGEHTWFVYSVFVRKPYQGQKIGEQLMEKAENFIKSQKGDKAVLYVVEGQKGEKAQNFYTQAGYKKIPEGKHKTWERMEKSLTS